MSLHLLTKAFGDGDLSSSPLIKSALNWLYKEVVVNRDRVSYDDFGELEAHTAYLHEAFIPSFDLSKYSVVQEFLSEERIMENQDHDLLSTDSFTSFMLSFRDAALKFVDEWVEKDSGVVNAELEALRQLRVMMHTSVLFEVMRLPIHEGLFFDGIAEFCRESEERKAEFKNLYGITRALEIFPDAEARGAWLEESLGM